MICLVELCGPSRFSHFDQDGDPVGVAHPNAWVQIAAVSREQTKNTMTMIPALISEQMKSTYDLTDGKELIYADHGKKRLEAVTSNYRSLEGARSTFVLLNETQHWVSGNGGIKMYETIDGNATKGAGNRFLCITNAYLPGENSVAELMRGAYQDILEGRAPNTGFLYDSIEADPRSPLTPESLYKVIPVIRGDAEWLDVDDIIASIMQTNISPARSRRMWLNQIVADEDALYRPADLRAIESDDGMRPGDEVALGFDGGRTDDATALVAIRMSDGLIEPLYIEQRPHGLPREQKWEVDRIRVSSEVASAFKTFKVRAFYADVSQWESYISEWAQQYGPNLAVKASDNNAIAKDMRGLAVRWVANANEFMMRSVLDQKVKFGKPNTEIRKTLRSHFLNARRHDTVHGVSFRKESADSPNKVDGYAAALLANLARNDVLQKAKPTRTSSRGWFF